MKRSMAIGAALVTLFALGFAGHSVGRGSAQDEGSPDATVAALQTAVVDLQTRVAALETPGATTTAVSRVPTVAGPIGGTPIAATHGIEVLYVYAQPAPFGANIFGEVENTTETPAAAPTITATLTDGHGNTVDTVSLYTPFTVIQPGGKMGFEGSTRHGPDEWTKLAIAVSGGEPATASQIASEPAGVEIRSVNEVTKTDTSLQVLGEVYNGSTGTVRGVVRVLFYRADGRYGGSQTRLGSFSALAPGEAGSFKFATTVDLGPDWTYQIVPDVYPVSETPPEVDQGITEIVDGTPYAGTPAAARTGIQLLYFYARPGRYSGSRLLAEARNTTDEIMNSPALYVTFYDAQDRIIDSHTIFPFFGIMKPGETTPYDGFGDLDPDQWARYTVRMSDSEPSAISTVAAYPKGLEFRNVEETDRTETGIRLVGEIVNTGDQTVTYVNALALFYRADGRYAGYQWVSTEPDELAPGESGKFTLLADVDAGTDWTYRLIARGTPKS